MALKALIFDFDGLILDTETPEYEGWATLYSRYGAEFRLEDWLKIVGSSYTTVGIDPVEDLILYSNNGLTREEIEKSIRVLHDELIARQDIQPGIIRLLDEGKNSGLSIAIGSSSPHHWVDSHLKRFGIFDRFNSIVCGDDVDQIKPQPDIYLKVIKHLGIGPDEAIVFEDSRNGVNAALAAGLTVVAVPNSVTQHSDLSAANKRVQSLDEVDVDSLREWFIQSNRTQQGE